MHRAVDAAAREEVDDLFMEVNFFSGGAATSVLHADFPCGGKCNASGS